MKQIPHRTGKDSGGFFPSERFFQSFRMKSYFKWIVFRISIPSLEPVSHSPSVAILAPFRDRRAARYRVPDFISPLDFSFCHKLHPLLHPICDFSAHTNSSICTFRNSLALIRSMARSRSRIDFILDCRFIQYSSISALVVA